MVGAQAGGSVECMPCREQPDPRAHRPSQVCSSCNDILYPLYACSMRFFWYARESVSDFDPGALTRVLLSILSLSKGARKDVRRQSYYYHYYYYYYMYYYFYYSNN